MEKLIIGSEVKLVKTGYERVEAERELELKMVRRGVRRFNKNVNKSKALRNELTGKEKEATESTTLYGQHLLQEAITPVNLEIEKYFTEAFNGHSKKYAKAAELLTKCIPIKELENPSEKKWNSVSLIALKVILDSITIGCTQTKATIKIGNSLEDESRLLFFSENDSKTYSLTKQYLKTRNDYRYKRKVYAYAMGKSKLEYGSWSKVEKVQLGYTLIDLIIRATGIVKLQRRLEGKENSPIYVEATEKTMEWVRLKKLHSEILKPMRTPMLILPKEWTTPFDGGYLTKGYPKEVPQSWRDLDVDDETKQQQEINSAL